MKNTNKCDNWEKLPLEIWVLILSKLKTVDIIENVQKVCTLFRHICNQPSMFVTVDMSIPFGCGIDKLPYDIHIMTRHAITRNPRGVTDVYIEFLFCETTINYIGNRCKNLKSLRLAHLGYFSNSQYNAVIKAMKRLPMLEQVHLTSCNLSDSQIEGVGHACPSLQSFLLTRYDHCFLHFDQEAEAISRSMPNVRRLMLYGNDMSTKGFKAILDSCHLLEYLDLRGCSNITFDRKLWKICKEICRGITCVRYPDDPCDDIVAQHQLWRQHMLDGQSSSDIPSTSSDKRTSDGREECGVDYDYDYDSVSLWCRS